jgi:glycosyltransferase involved in cell wall biosynthesis
MKLLFVNASAIQFHVGTPERAPLGGTESAAAYLARQLAALGHDVTLMSPLPEGTPERLMGVRHVPFEPTAFDTDFFAAEDFDAIIPLSVPASARHFKQTAPRALLVSWMHVMPGVPSMLPLQEMTPWIDCAVLVSAYHGAQVRFRGATQVIGNGIAPVFENMFGSSAELRAAKQNRAVYTSQPDRGLEVLADVMAQARLETAFDIYSGTSIYQQKDDPFTQLYDRIANTPRCHYHGPVAQAVLAERLKHTAFLSYPTIYLETYCIAALEAIAAGLKVISTNCGALAETTLGFADLIPLPRVGAVFVANFSLRMEEAERQFLAHPEEWAEERFAQSQAVNRQCSWAARAKEWEAFLGPAISWRRSA